MIILLILTISALSVYSYALIDPNLTLINHPLWIAFRDPMVNLGYHMRATSTNIYITLLLLLFFLHLIIIKKYKKYSPLKVSFMIGGILLFSYPLFSHDLFSYIFDAKILTYYGKSPYVYMPGDFYQDEWLRFMHWTDRSYPYGPSFLLLTLIPSILAMGKFILNFLLFKLLFVISYVVAVYYLEKLNKRWSLFFATHPLILIEGVINTHNDLISVTFGIMGIYYIWQNKQIFGRFWFLLSGGIKFLTIPVILLSKNNKTLNVLALAGQLLLIGYLIVFREIQSWYFLTLFIFIPVFPSLIHKIQIFLFGLLLSYYPYIRYGGWDSDDKISMKHNIILVFFIINALYLILLHLPKFRSYFLKK